MYIGLLQPLEPLAYSISKNVLDISCSSVLGYFSDFQFFTMINNPEIFILRSKSSCTSLINSQHMYQLRLF